MLRRVGKGKKSRGKQFWIPVMIALLGTVAVIVAFSLRLKGHVFSRADRRKVCVVDDRLFHEEISSAVIDALSYSVCCDTCKRELEKHPLLRLAVDPLTEKQIDKALAVIGSSREGSVYYFENDATFLAYREKMISGSLEHRHR